jgi:hypothetical protein
MFKIEPENATIHFELENYLALKIIKMPTLHLNAQHRLILQTNGFGLECMMLIMQLRILIARYMLSIN